MTEFALVLVEPKIHGNIGAVARAMMNFGMRELRIVGNARIEEEARQRAVHAQEILNHAIFFTSFQEAVKDVDYRAATTGVAPDNEKRHLRSHLELEEFAKKAMEVEGKIALIFGREDFGIFNSELRLCDVVITIPTSPDYPIMNLSHSVSTVLYQIFVEARRSDKIIQKRREAPRENMDLFFHRIEQLLKSIDYPEHKLENTSIMVRRILGRALVSRWEYHTLMGILSKIEGALGFDQKQDEK